jgi:type III pantothenate kinase
VPTNTDDAIVSGCLAATAGAIAHMQTQAGSDACIISGGDAASLSALLTGQVMHVPDLVLEGLARSASEARQNG